MAEEIRIEVSAPGAGQAANDLEKVASAKSKAAKAPPEFAPHPEAKIVDVNAPAGSAFAASAPVSQKIVTPRRMSLDELERQAAAKDAANTSGADADRQAYFNTKLEATSARAAGNEAEAAALEREAEILKRTALIQKELNADRATSEKIARQTLADEEKIAAAKEHQRQTAQVAKETEQAQEESRRAFGLAIGGAAAAGMTIEHGIEALTGDENQVTSQSLARTAQFRDQNKQNLIDTLGVRTPWGKEEERLKLFQQEKALREQLQQQVPNPNRYTAWGAGIGAVIGGTVGSIVPGVGTVAGAGVGSTLGAGAGSLFGRSSFAPTDPAVKAREDIENQIKQIQNQQQGLDAATSKALTGMARFRQQSENEWKADYEKFKAAGAPDSVAREGADQLFHEHRRKWTMGMVNAGSGAADIARAASFAVPPDHSTVSDSASHAIKQMHGMIDAHFKSMKAANQMPEPDSGVGAGLGF